MLIEVAAAETTTIRVAPSMNRHQNRFGFGAGSSPPGGGGLNSISAIGEPLREQPQESLERLGIGAQRCDRDPLLRSVVSGPDRAELHGGDADTEEGDGVGGSVAPDAHRLALMMLSGCVAQGEDEGG